MATKRIEKEALVAATVTFTQSNDEFESPNPSFPNVTIDIIGLTALNGSPVIPGAGTFDIFYKTDVDGGFKAATTNPTLTAAQSGGSASADGAAESSKFTDLPLEIKVVPTGITTAVAYRVLVKQTSDQ